MLLLDDTIAAIATPLGMGAIGIVRLSGPEALSIAQKLFQPAREYEAYTSHKAYFGRLVDPQTQKHLDQVLFLYMRGPHSFTGQDCVEFQCHGGPFLLKRVLEHCLALGARLADKGEFSQRAFLNGKLDLTQAEAIFDLIHGRNQNQVTQATYQLEGHLTNGLKAVRQTLLDTLVALEAAIDFPDEVDDVPESEVEQALDAALTETQRLLGTAEAGRILKEGLRVALVGQPNVGKSTLLNQLLRYERAIVSHIPGTTRDTVEDDYNLRGIPLKIIDTAGLRETEDLVESIGIARSRDALSGADIVLLVVDATQGWSESEDEIMSELSDKPVLVIFNKLDLLTEPFSPPSGVDALATSALDFETIEQLEETLYERLIAGKELDYQVTINERHRLCLVRAEQALLKSRSTLGAGLPGDFLSIDIKEALLAFGEVMGESLSEEVIHEIFHRFCVGK